VASRADWEYLIPMLTLHRITAAAVIVLGIGTAEVSAAVRPPRVFAAIGVATKPYTEFHAPYLFRGCERWFRVWLAHGENYLERRSACGARRGRAVKVKG
jgi:hypothetical protein